MAEISSEEKRALHQIELIEEPSRLKAFISNARSKKSRVVEAAAFSRLCFVQPEATPGTVEHDVWQSIYALEQMHLEERGKTILLSRTRQKIAKDGEAKTVADLVRKKTASAGFDDLISRGFPDLTFEAVALRHPKTFGDTVCSAAHARLVNADVDVDKILLPIKEPSSDG